MNLMYVSDLALAKMQRAVPENVGKYAGGARWASDVALGAGWARESGIAVEDLPPLTLYSPKDDLENTRIVYNALRKLSPVQAMDERLWAYLTHATWWEYMTKRWENPNENQIRSRFFLKNRGISGLVLNGISRLWWFGHLTFDPSLDDPYSLTKVLLKSQDIQTGLLQRTFGRSADVRRGALKFLDTHWSMIELAGKKSGGASKVTQGLWIDLNLAGGVAILDSVGETQLGSILADSLQGYGLKAEPVETVAAN